MRRFATVLLAVVIMAGCTPAATPGVGAPLPVDNAEVASTTAPRSEVTNVANVDAEETTPTATPDPPPGAQPTLAQLEGRWACDIQRYAFKSLADMDARLDARLSAAGYTRDDYDEFKRKLGTDPDLTAQVSAEYDAYCGETSSS